MDQCGFRNAIRKLADYYGVSNDNGGQGHRSKPKPSASQRAAGRQPEKAEDARRRMGSQGFRVTAEYGYGPYLRKVRYEHETQRQDGKDRPEKEFRWEHRIDEAWYSGDGGKPKPLYLNGVFRERDQIGLVLGFEGEAKADLAGELGFAAFSFKDLNEEQAATLVDAEVVLWPDNDQSGEQQAQTAARRIAEHGQIRSLGIITPPDRLPPGGDIIDAIQNMSWDSHQIARLIQVARPFVAAKTERTSRSGQSVRDGAKKEKTPTLIPVATVSAAELCRATYPPTEWQVEGILRADDMSALIGKQKSGKSLFALQLAASISTGRDFLGHRVPKPRKVLYFDFENKPPDLQDRLRKMFGERSKEFGLLRFYCPISMGEREVGFWDARSKKKFTDTIQVEDPDLVIIDVMNIFFGCDDKDSRQMTHRLMDLAKIRRTRPGLSVLLLHHPRKTVGDQYRVQLRKDPALWMEYARGSNVLLTHCDLLYGLERERSDLEDPGVYVFTGITRYFAEPLIILKRDPESLLYSIAPADRIFTAAQKGLWDRLPISFRFNMVIKDLSCARKLLSAVIKLSVDAGLLEKLGKTYYKTQVERGDCETEASEAIDREEVETI
jgi:hypothetical protein